MATKCAKCGGPWPCECGYQPENPTPLEAEDLKPPMDSPLALPYPSCRKCDRTLNLLVMPVEGRVTYPLMVQDAATRRWNHNTLTIDGTGIYCRACGTHLTEAEAVVEAYNHTHAQHP